MLNSYLMWDLRIGNQLVEKHYKLQINLKN